MVRIFKVLVFSGGPDYTIYRIKTLNEINELSNLCQMIPTNINSKGMECYFISYCYKTAIPKTKTCLCWQTISPSLKTFKAHYDREKMFQSRNNGSFKNNVTQIQVGKKLTLITKILFLGSCYNYKLYRVFKLDLHQKNRLLGHQKCTLKS